MIPLVVSHMYILSSTGVDSKAPPAACSSIIMVHPPLFRMIHSPPTRVLPPHDGPAYLQQRVSVQLPLLARSHPRRIDPPFFRPTPFSLPHRHLLASCRPQAPARPQHQSQCLRRRAPPPHTHQATLPLHSLCSPSVCNQPAAKQQAPRTSHLPAAGGATSRCLAQLLSCCACLLYCLQYAAAASTP